MSSTSAVRRGRWPRRAAAAALLAAVTCGCVGVTVKHTNRTVWPAPRLLVSTFGLLEVSDGSEPPASADVEALWGRPDAIELGGPGEERWRYDSRELRWLGVIVYVVILPVPLILPVGHESVTLTVRDGRVVAAEVVQEDEAQARVGFILDGGPCMTMELAQFERSQFEGVPYRDIRP